MQFLDLFENFDQPVAVPIIQNQPKRRAANLDSLIEYDTGSEKEMSLDIDKGK